MLTFVLRRCEQIHALCVYALLSPGELRAVGSGHKHVPAASMTDKEWLTLHRRVLATSAMRSVWCTSVRQECDRLHADDANAFLSAGRLHTVSWGHTHRIAVTGGLPCPLPHSCSITRPCCHPKSSCARRR